MSIYNITSKLKILWIKNWRYRDGNKSPETRFNKEYVHSSKTEQASELAMTPALYRRTINKNDVFIII